MPLHSIDQRLRQLQLRTRYPVEHLLAGEYRSVFKGRGLDFDEICPYHPGEEVRSIDWNVTARTGRPYVKRYVEERELAVWLVVDASASCRIAAPGRTKWDAIHELAALLTLSATRNHDRVGMIVCSDRVEQILPPRKGRQHALRLLADLLAVEPRSPGSDPGPALDALLHMARRRVLVVMLSDFLFDIDRQQLGRSGVSARPGGHRRQSPQRDRAAAVRTGRRPRRGDGPDAGGGPGARGTRSLPECVRRPTARLRDEFAAVRADFLELDTHSDCAEELARFFRHRLRRTADETGG